jgi:hypothetical protein
VTGLGLVIEMELDPTSLKLPQHIFDASLDGRMVRSVTSGEFLNNSPERRSRQFGVLNTHRISLPDKPQNDPLLNSP